MGALGTYRGLVANGPLTRLPGGEFVSAVGDWLYIVALLVVIYREIRQLPRARQPAGDAA